MSTFVYAPAIRVHIESSGLGIIDISDDISSWDLTRRSNSVSSFNFVLQNTQRKYDGVFQPSDRITVSLKRLTWIPVFTGSLNNVPIFTSWPQALSMSASCTLKVFQFWPWDPTTTAANSLVTGLISDYVSSTTSTAGDSGFSKVITKAINQVVPVWPANSIHIGAVPNDWFAWAQATEQDINAEASMAAVLGAGSTINGTSSGFVLPVDFYAGEDMTESKAQIAAQIYQTVLQVTASLTPAQQDRAATIALMVACTESHFFNYTHAVDHSSLGVFQQQDPWGTAANRENVAWATTHFLQGVPGVSKGLFGQSDWQTGRIEVVGQQVQRSAFDGFPRTANNFSSVVGSNYLTFVPTAQAIVAKLRPQANNLVSSTASGTGIFNSNAGIPTGGASTGNFTIGDNVAATAYNLIANHTAPKGPPIQYSRTNRVGPTTDIDKVTYLDCSALDAWVYYHASGHVWGPDIASAQYQACTHRDIPMSYAQRIRGCFLFGIGEQSGSFGQDASRVGHTGISLGTKGSDGNWQHVAAHTDGIPVVEQVNVSSVVNSGLYSGGLAPGIDYTLAAADAETAAYLTKLTGKVCSVSPNNTIASVVSGVGNTSATGTPVGSDFEKLISAVVSAPVGSGTIFGGPRELINNQPFLPWLGNLTNSSMRAYCSAPNGDFMAWFPDYFNVWGTAAIMDIKTIELQDFTVEWSDQQIVTHEFVLGSLLPTFDGGSGQIVDHSSADYQQLGAMLATQGIVTMEFPAIFKTIYGKAASPDFTRAYLRRFGGRPLVESFPNIQHGVQEFYMALWMFMKHWASQFNATIPMTFMPELWPGMILQISEMGFQAYVSEVKHSGSYGPNGKFTTEATVIAPGAINEQSGKSLFGILDIFGTGTAKTAAPSKSKVIPFQGSATVR